MTRGLEVGRFQEISRSVICMYVLSSLQLGLVDASLHDRGRIHRVMELLSIRYLISDMHAVLDYSHHAQRALGPVVRNREVVSSGGHVLPSIHENHPDTRGGGAFPLYSAGCNVIA